VSFVSIGNSIIRLSRVYSPHGTSKKKSGWKSTSKKEARATGLEFYPQEIRFNYEVGAAEKQSG
jgi:hypothetical protein